jgi:Carboxypeptidase regulatory-like domain
MSGGRRRRSGRARVGALASLLLAACATSPPRPPLADDSPPTFAPPPHALSAAPALRAAPPPPIDRGPSDAPASEFVKPGECAIEGVVLAPGGTPVEGANVFVRTRPGWPIPRTIRARTGADGRFRVAVAPETHAELCFVTPTSPPHGFRHPVEKIRVDAGGAKDLVVRLRAGETVAGRVVDAHGDAVEGLRLRTAVPGAMSSGDYFAAETVTSPGGWFAFDGLPAGFATIVEDRRADSVAEHLLLDAAQVRTGTAALLVRRLPVGVVRGRVEDATGRPFAKSTVVLARKGAALKVEARTDADGRFRASVAVPGRYVVRLRVATQSGHADRDVGEIDAPAADERTFVAPPVHY